MNWVREFFIRLVVLTLPHIRAETYAPFIKKGRILRVRAVIDLHIHVDFSTIRSQCQEIYNSAKLLKLSSHADDTHFRFSADRALLEVERLCKSPIFSLSHHDLLQIHRERRQLGLGIAVGAIASYAVSSLFSSSTHSSKVENHNFEILDKEIQGLQTYLATLATRIEKSKSKSEAQLRLVQIQAFAQSTRTIVSEISNGFISLIQGRLSTDILPVGLAKIELAKISRLASSFKAHLPFSDVLSLYTFPVLHEMEEKHITFTIRIPLVDREYVHWRFLQSPMLIEHDSDKVFITPIPRKSHLAVPTSGNSIALSRADLDHCSQWSNDYFCTYLPTRRNDDACLDSLFHEPTDIMSVCDFSLPDFPEYVLTHLNENQFLLSLNISSLSFEETCDNGTRFGTFMHGQKIIQLSDGCSISTKLFDIPRFSAIQRSVRIRPFLPTFNKDILDKNITSLSPEFSLLQHWKLRELENETPLSHWPFHLGTLLIAILFVISMFTCLRIVFRRRQKNSNHT